MPCKWGPASLWFPIPWTGEGGGETPWPRCCFSILANSSLTLASDEFMRVEGRRGREKWLLCFLSSLIPQLRIVSLCMEDRKVEWSEFHQTRDIGDIFSIFMLEVDSVHHSTDSRVLPLMPRTHHPVVCNDGNYRCLVYSFSKSRGHDVHASRAGYSGLCSFWLSILVILV